MITHHRFFDFNGKRLIERLVVKTPFKYGAVFNNEACFLYLKEGGTNLASPTDTLKVSTNEAVILQCGTYFAQLVAQKPSNTCEVIAVHLYPDILKEIYQDDFPMFVKGSSQAQHAQKLESKEVMVHFIDSLVFYFDNPQLVSSGLLRLKLQELVLLLLNTEFASTLHDLFARLFTPRQAGLAQVVQAHLFSPLSVAEMAVLAGRSLSSFKREFSVIYQTPPARFLRDKRLEKACELIENTDLSIADVCFRLGFADAAHFNRLFKAKYQLTPLAYRKRERGVLSQTFN